MKALQPLLKAIAPDAVVGNLRLAPALQNIPLTQDETAAGTLITLPLATGTASLLVVSIAQGQPRHVRQTIHELCYRRSADAPYLVLFALYMSERAAEVCRQEGVGYVDREGNCRLAFDSIFIQNRVATEPDPEKRQLKSLYAPKAERVLRVLLLAPGRHWRLQALAEEARVSLGQVANVKKLLADRDWMARDDAGVFLDQPDALLEDWARHYDADHHEARQFYSPLLPHELEARLTEEARDLGLRHALTEFSGAARVAPHVRYQRATAYVEVGQSFAQLVQALGLKAVTSGANVKLLRPYDEGVFYGAREIDGTSIASPVQLYLDLRSAKGRGEEAAQAVLEEGIRPLWQ